MDKKAAQSNLFIIFHLLVLFIITIITSANTRLFGSVLAAFVYYIILAALPVFLYIGVIERQNPWKALGFANQPLKGTAYGLLIGGVIFAAFFALGRWAKIDTAENPPVTWLLVLGSITAGVAEEVLFRGFVLPRMMAQVPFIKANILSSMLFAALHVAALAESGLLMIPQLVLLFIISLWLGYLYKKTRLLWTVIWVHMLYNAAILML